MSLPNERPGVYSEFDASSVISTLPGARVVGAVGVAALPGGGQPVTVTGYAQAVSLFGGEGQGLTELVRLALAGGAARVVALPVSGETPGPADYRAAFDALNTIEDIPILICDSPALAVQQALRDAVAEASEARRERIAVVGLGEDDPAALAARADALQSERMVLVGPRGLKTDGGVLSGPYLAAAVAGVMAQNTDPALPLGGAAVPGLGGLTARYGDNEIDLLITGGVTPLEELSGTVSVLRAVTTRTETGGVPDPTWRELSTVLIADHVIAGLRRSLRARFARAKNTEQVRGAVRSHVIMDLEAKKTAQIIDGYRNVAAEQAVGNPTVCVVSFEFAVAHALNQIYLTAHILV
ncbi:MAG: phage tail sheath subtilisin-like domain-containing protein [Oscillospiraceae bacterium]|jgi:phage tail sheath gpL-like|nr:phage tail sheath subtilisin-like domain-containing protein [Oscillospiraceae bacterium]